MATQVAPPTTSTTKRSADRPVGRPKSSSKKAKLGDTDSPSASTIYKRSKLDRLSVSESRPVLKKPSHGKHSKKSAAKEGDDTTSTTKTTKNPAELSEKHQPAYYKNFDYGNHISSKPVWKDLLKKDGKEDFDTLVGQLEANQVEAYEVEPRTKDGTPKVVKKIDPKHPSDEWIAPEEVFNFILKNWEKESSSMLLRTPQIEKSAHSLITDGMNMMGTAILEEYSGICRDKGRLVVNTTDAAQQILSRHGTKDGTYMLEGIKTCMQDAVESLTADDSGTHKGNSRQQL